MKKLSGFGKYLALRSRYGSVILETIDKEKQIMEEEFIPYEQALALKELGFDNPCFGFYIEDKTWVPASYSREGTVYPSNSDLIKGWVSAPIYQQVFRWFREKYDLRRQYGTFPHHTIITNYLIDGGKEEEAELECLKKLIEIVKENK